MTRAKPVAPDDYRALLYMRQSVVNTKFVDDTALNACQRWLQIGKISILIRQKGEKIGYAHLQTCKKRWVCPVCADRMARQTRRALARAIEAESACDYHPLFITYTAKHLAGESLSVVSGRLQRAHRALHSGKQFSKAAAIVSYDGSFRALEITIGNSGWHFHIHELAFVDRQKTSDEFTDLLVSRWSAEVAKVDGYASPEHGLDIREADAEVKDYAEKFGIAPELTQGVQKAKDDGGLLPFQLCEVALTDSRRAKWAADMFSEYAAATRGLKQTATGGALRPLFRHIKDNPDVPDYETNILASLTIDEWRHVVRTGKRAALLTAVEQRDSAGVSAIIGRLTTFDV